MKEEILARWAHSHGFGQEKKRPGELRTFIVIALTTGMMAVEITAGIAYGSIALLADGLHMGSHAVALSVNAFAYVYARRQAFSERFSFGTGKVNTLGGYTGAILLALFALLMAWESCQRLLNPINIAFNQAIAIATVGLVVNGVSVFILGDHHEHDHAHGPDHHHHEHDHNLKAAYLHVLADALTSLLAIAALLAGKYFGALWMDPVMGLVGALLVARWSYALLKSTSAILLDMQESDGTIETISNLIEASGEHRVVDFHLWSIGSGLQAALVTVVSSAPQPPDYYRQLIGKHHAIAHLTIEVHAYAEQTAGSEQLASDGASTVNC